VVKPELTIDIRDMLMHILCGFFESLPGDIKKSTNSSLLFVSGFNRSHVQGKYLDSICSLISKI
jgi:hypothetical protein